MSENPIDKAKAKAPSSEAFLVDQLKALQKQVEDLQRVNKNSLSRLPVNEADRGIKIKVATYRENRDEQPLLVTSWRTIQDLVDYTPGAPRTENQVVEVTLENGDAVKMPYLAFAKTAFEKQEVPVTSTTIKNGEKFYTFDLNGKELTLSEKFVNQ